MTSDATKQFLNCTRAELVRVQAALSEVPAYMQGLRDKEGLLSTILQLYGEPYVGNAVKIEEPPAPSKTVPVSDASLQRMQTRADRADRADKSLAIAHAVAPRPEGAPTNFQMTYQVLRDGPGDGLTATLIVEEIRKKWWPGVKFDQVAPDFYRFVNDGRLQRDDYGKMILTEKGRGLGVASTVRAPKPAPKSVAKKAAIAGPANVGRLTPEQIDQAREAAGATAKVQTRDVFEHNQRTITLPIAEARLAKHLHKVMGSGCIGHEKLAEVAGVSKNGSAVDDLVFGLNMSLGYLKLKVVPYEKLGYFMKETA